jgi:hypothetical protein
MTARWVNTKWASHADPISVFESPAVAAHPLRQLFRFSAFAPHAGKPFRAISSICSQERSISPKRTSAGHACTIDAAAKSLFYFKFGAVLLNTVPREVPCFPSHLLRALRSGVSGH